MDHQRRPLYAQQQPPPPPPPPSAADHQRPPPPPQQQQHYQYPQPPQGPPPSHPQQQQQQQQHAPSHPHQQQHPPPTHHSQGPPPPSSHPPYQGAPHLPPSQGPALPPLQATAYAPPASSSEQPNLPSFRHPSAPTHPDSREGPPPDYHSQYNHNHSRSGHATPAPVNRSYSHDSGPQRSPATPGPYPPNPGQDGIPPPGPPQPHPMDHGGHHGYPPANGVPHGLPPPPPHHEPHPHQMTPMMDGHYQYPPPGQPIYGAPTYGPTTANIYGPKRKQMRATQACEQCRARKQKCDEGNPCSFCKENNMSCQYRDTPPAKTDKNMDKLLSLMEAHSDGLTRLTQKIDTFEQRLRVVEDNAQQSRPSISSNHRNSIAPNNQLPQRMQRPQEDPAPVLRKSEMDDHRTAPHKLLLLWPSVRPLLTAAQIEHHDGYVMEAEDRGVLRLWTRGEGIDEYDGTQPGGPASPARSDESGEGANAGTPHNEGLWGAGFPSTPGSDTRRSEPSTAGGLKANGEIDLDAHTVNQLYDSYMKHLHIMHPFLDKRRLRRMFDNFTRRYSTGKPRATFAVSSNQHDGERPLKRQRSNGPSANNINGTGIENEVRRADPTERSPGNAIIYLVLALGKICQHKEPLPPIVPDSRLQTNTVISHQISAANRGVSASSPISASMKPLSASPKSTPQTHGTPPSEVAMRRSDSRSRRSSMEGSQSPGNRNLDVVPGIAYYAKAAEILGDQGDGNDLVHAQMFLLAGLYKGQLARVKESMSWITMAGRAIRTLLDRYKLYNGSYWSAYGDKKADLAKDQAKIKDTRQSLIVLASWTCLQLESDILAELRLPSSGIQDTESLLLLPHKAKEDESYAGFEPDGRQEDYDNILLFYTAQLFLRRRLNQIHRELYGPDCLNTSIEEVREMILSHEGILDQWREGLPVVARWEDDDDPPSDILAARLRAKYWGGKYIATRPFLDYALHIMPLVEGGEDLESIAKDGHGNPRDKADVHLFKAIRTMGESQIWRAVERCVKAAEKSTLAFDGIIDKPGRLIVTNIHGTAHAQFGNVLVLSAAYHKSFLRNVIPGTRLKSLLERTITFLRRLAPISPTCAADCGILEKFQKTLFPAANELPHVYRNEGVEPMSATSSFNHPS